MITYAIVSLKDGTYVSVDVWCGETMFWCDLADATTYHSEAMAHAVLRDVKASYPGEYDIIDIE